MKKVEAIIKPFKLDDVKKSLNDLVVRSGVNVLFVSPFLTTRGGVRGWGGAQVTRWDPNSGKLLEQIPVPALHTSSCVFGGRDMNELYVTSARKGMSETVLIKYPLSGGLFKVVTKTEGMKTFEFG